MNKVKNKGIPKSYKNLAGIKKAKNQLRFLANSNIYITVFGELIFKHTSKVFHIAFIHGDAV